MDLFDARVAWMTGNSDEVLAWWGGLSPADKREIEENLRLAEEDFQDLLDSDPAATSWREGELLHQQRLVLEQLKEAG